MTQPTPVKLAAAEPPTFPKRLRVWFFGPRRVSMMARLAAATMLLLLLALYAQALIANGHTQDQVEARSAIRNAQTCASVGADLVLFDYLTGRGLAVKDKRFASLLSQAVATKRQLRDQLGCPPYPPPPVVPPVPAESPKL